MPIVVKAAMQRIGFQVLEDGNVAIIGFDESLSELHFVLEPAAWREFLRNAQRIRGVGIAQANRVHVVNANGEVVP